MIVLDVAGGVGWVCEEPIGSGVGKWVSWKLGSCWDSDAPSPVSGLNLAACPSVVMVLEFAGWVWMEWGCES